jgi:hypothetical protein
VSLAAENSLEFFLYDFKVSPNKIETALFFVGLLLNIPISVLSYLQEDSNIPTPRL